MVDQPTSAAGPTTLGRGLAEWFRQPPRRHGEPILHRTVSYLELFYDLVYVVCISQAAHTLAADVSWPGVGRFAVVFGLIWVAWMNGTLYHELHGRDDGRSRLYVFLQMVLLAVLAVFTAHAGDVDGAAFAITLAILFTVITWLWYQVQRVDRGAYRDTTMRYLAAMVVTIAATAGSAALDDDSRAWLWGLLVVGWIGFTARTFSRRDAVEIGVTITHSMVERFALLVIIVLGEVVVGVVDGMAETGRDALAITTGSLGLVIGFGLWWNYFDMAGARMPTGRAGGWAMWVFAHVPLTAAIAASGAAMVSLVEHAHDGRTPAPTSWLMAGSVAVMLVTLAVLLRSLVDWNAQRRLSVFSARALLAAVPPALVVGWLRPAPWVLALVLVAVLAAPWIAVFAMRVRLGHGPAPLAPAEPAELG